MAKRMSVLVALIGLLSACGSSSDSNESDGKLRVVATTPVIADFVRVVGGPEVEVYDVVKVNVDPHEYEPSPADLNALRQAALIFESGVGLEEWLKSTIDSSGTKAEVVSTSAGIRLRKGPDDGVDPHVWHSPAGAKVMVANIAQALGRHRAEDAEGFAIRQQAYDAQLQQLDDYNRTALAALTNKNLVTNHDSLGYYVDEYGLNYVGAVIPSFDSQAEVSSTQINDLVATIKQHKVKAVFAEATLPSRTAEAVAREAGVKVVSGVNGLYGDSLGPPGSPAATYLEMERHNTDVIVANLR